MFEDLANTSYDQGRIIRNLETKVKELQGEKDNLTAQMQHEKEITADALKLAELAGKKSSLVEVERDMLRPEVEKLKAEAELRKKQEEENLEAIRATHFESWMEDWLDTEEGNTWLTNSSKGSCAMGYLDAVRNAKAHYSEVDVPLLMSEMKGCEGIRIDNEGQAFLLPEIAEASSSARDDNVRTPSDVVDAITRMLDTDEAYDVAMVGKVALDQTAQDLRTVRECFGSDAILPVTTAAKGATVANRAEGQGEEEDGRVQIPDVCEDED